MRVGFLGLGRLGLPIAAVLSQHHPVTGYDPDPGTASRLVMGHPWEEGLTEYLGEVALAGSATAAVIDADVVVVCVQTPHDPVLDGTSETPRREPFDLSYVEAALRSVGQNGPPVVVMSTVLPGDCRRLAPLVSDLIYSPAFPAMGTTVQDVLDPEFIIYAGSKGLVEKLWGFVNAPVVRCANWETAELAKLAYNTAIGAKIGLANTVAWIADAVGADGGEVMDVLTRAKRRIISPAYLSPGLGDGGACHPRDQLAMSYLARREGVYDWFGDLIDQRAAHSRWIASVVTEVNPGLPYWILGSAYKRDSPLRDGSPALLLANQTGWFISDLLPETPHCVIVGIDHSEYESLTLPEGSVVVDPWGIVTSNVLVVRPGR